MIIFLIVSVVVVVIDQLTKFAIYGSAPISVIGNFLWFESTLNTGIAFSMFQNSSFVFIITSSVASVVLLCLIFSKKYFKTKLEKVSLALILGGALGNLVDRIIFGGVRDFISLKFMNFAIFNIADSAVCIGAFLLCLSIIILLFKEKKMENKTDDRA